MKEYNSRLIELIESRKKEFNEKKRIILKLKIISKANRTEFAGLMDDGTIKLAVSEAAEKGKANAEICSFLSKEFNVGKRDVKILSGHSSKLKLILIQKED
jgi:uncharacterized protein (TIGR00251 family)